MQKIRRKVLALILSAACSVPLVSLWSSPPAHAEANDSRLVLRVEGPLGDASSRERLRVAIASELGIDVSFDADGVAGRATISIRIKDDNVAIIGFTARGSSVSRTVNLPDKPARRIDVITLIVGNLARDEAGDWLAQLHAKGSISIGGPSASSSASSDRAPVASNSTEPSWFETSPLASAPAAPSTSPSASTSSSATTVSSAMPVASAAPSAVASHAPVAPSARVPCGHGRLSAGLDLFPYVGASSITYLRDSARVVSINAVAGLSGGLAGVEVGGVANIDQNSSCGVQVGGVTNIVDGSFSGVQVGGVVNVVHGDFFGVQVGGVANIVAGGIDGVQVAGVLNIVDDWKGVQIAGVFNRGLEGRGLQVATANFSDGIDGSQVGVANVSGGDVHGLQVGVVNVARGDVSGVQVGLVNIADDADAGVGLINIYPKGKTFVESWSNESGLFTMAVDTGGRRFRTLAGVGVQPGLSSQNASSHDALMSWTLGTRARLRDQPDWSLDLDALIAWLWRFRSTTSSTFQYSTIQPELRLLAGISLFDDVKLLFGPNVRVLITGDADTQSTGLWSGRLVYDSRRATSSGERGTAVWIIPGVTLGVRL